MDAPLSAITSLNYGLKSMDGVKQRIVFTTYATQADYIATAVPDIGLDVYTSPKI